VQFKGVVSTTTKLDIWTEQDITLNCMSSLQDVERVACGQALAFGAAEVGDRCQALVCRLTVRSPRFGCRRRRHRYETGVERRLLSVSPLEATATYSDQIVVAYQPIKLKFFFKVA